MSQDNPPLTDTAFSAHMDEGLPSRRSNLLALLEGIALLGAVMLVDISGLASFADWPVHPFLFVVVLLSAQYGVLGGVLAALGATALTVLDGLPVRPIDMAYADYFSMAWADPLSWVLAALMVGIVTSNRGRLLAEQGERLRKSEMAESLIAAQYQVLAQRTRKLERSLAGQEEDLEFEGGHAFAGQKAKSRSPVRPRSRVTPHAEP